MKDKVFVDTNIFVYLYSNDEQEKRDRAIGVFDKYDCITSIQVLNELSNVLYKKFKLQIPLISLVIDEIVNSCEVAQIGIDTIRGALEVAEKYKYSYYDSLIISAALQNSCEMLISEDMQHNQIVDNTLKITNIFKN